MPALARRDVPLRMIAERLHLLPLDKLIRAPGIGEGCRLTIQYHDGRLPDQVATLLISQAQAGQAQFSVSYRAPSGKPLSVTPVLPIERARAVTAGLRSLGFDRLDDMPDLPWRDADLWLVERAVGSFSRDLVLAPQQASGPYIAVVALFSTQLWEALRPLNP